MKKGSHKYKFNESIFKNIDSKEKAYWHGFLSADGFINSNLNMLGVELSIKDEILIDRLISFFNAPKDIKRIRMRGKDKYHKKIGNINIVVYHCILRN